ncbi:hypothetical protein [Terrabacter sp. BE26]|uniref:hypothetical protein n=1 Tax=Terrabacter sp. BE26 TaxID=2898152 RepID=UPI0035BE270E
MSALDSARAVADAVLYEGYALYPYRASAPKNQVRWQWGVLMPADAVTVDPSERSSCRTDVVIDGRDPTLRVTVRFLQVQQRYVEDAGGRRVDRLDAGDTAYVPWDEACAQELVLDVPLPEGRATTVEVAGGTSTEELPHGVGRLVRVRVPLRVRVEVSAQRAVSPYPVTLVSVRVANDTGTPATPETDRPAWLRRALVACHLLLQTDASFVSQLEPGEWASGFVAGCVNEGVFPVLAGPPGQAHVVLSSPIILYDHPELAGASETAFFDSLEIDELLMLRTMTLSQEERREVRGTDPRTAALLREVDGMPPDLWDRLHGTVRYLDAMTSGRPEPERSPDVPWWDPGSDTSVDPERDAIHIGGVDVRRGSRVLLRPGTRRADAHDLFLAGRSATVAAVLHDVDGHQHLAVTVDDDPGANLKAAHGRYLYFAPDEVEPLSEVGG